MEPWRKSGLIRAAGLLINIGVFVIVLQEWSKYSNYKSATRVPWLLHIPSKHGRGPNLSQVFGPSQQESAAHKPAAGISVKKPSQLLDLFPTLVHQSGLPPLKKCNTNKVSIIRPARYLIHATHHHF